MIQGEDDVKHLSEKHGQAFFGIKNPMTLRTENVISPYKSFGLEMVMPKCPPHHPVGGGMKLEKLGERLKYQWTSI